MRPLSTLLRLLFCLSPLTMMMAQEEARPVGTTFFIDGRAGHNDRNGTTAETAWRDFTNVNQRALGPGDTILLKRGTTINQALVIRHSGSAAHPIVIDAYGEGGRPHIQRNNKPEDRSIIVENSSHVTIRNLEISRAGMGIWFRFTTMGHQGFVIENCYIHDCDLIVNRKPRVDDRIAISDAISFLAQGELFAAPGAWVAKDIRIVDNTVDRCTAPLRFAVDAWDPSKPPLQHQLQETPDNYQDILVANNSFSNARRNIATRGVKRCLYLGNHVSNMATLQQVQGTTGNFVWCVQDLTFINNFLDLLGHTGSNDQCHVDVEGLADRVSFFGNCCARAHSAQLEWLQLGPDRYFKRKGDHNTNQLVVGNTFYPTQEKAPLVFHLPVPWKAVTGSVRDNLYFMDSGEIHWVSPQTKGKVKVSFQGNRRTTAETDLYNAAKDFASKPGERGWSYQIFDGKTWRDLAYDKRASRWGTSRAYIDRFNLYPSPDSATRVARVWTASQDGDIAIRGRVVKSEIGAGDGVRARITVNDRVVWPEKGDAQRIAADDLSGHDTQVDLEVKKGDQVRFEIDNGDRGGSEGADRDRTCWIPSVGYVVSSGTDAPETAAPSADRENP